MAEKSVPFPGPTAPYSILNSKLVLYCIHYVKLIPFSCGYSSSGHDGNYWCDDDDNHCMAMSFPFHTTMNGNGTRVK